MISKQIFNNISNHIDINDAEKEYLDALFVVKQIKKKELILDQGQVANKLYFVESGSLRAYHIDEGGKESTIMFAIKDWWITDMNSFVNKSPSVLSIEALEDSKVIKIDTRSLEDLFSKIPKFERFFRILFQNAYVREQQRAFYNIAYSAEERFDQFINKYPAIVEKITQKQIASYLGVTPEFLSAIKKKKQ